MLEETRTAHRHVLRRWFLSAVIDELVYIHNRPDEPYLSQTIAGERDGLIYIRREEMKAECQKEIKTD